MSFWHFKYSACVDCGSKDYRHKAKGLCERCYAKQRWVREKRTITPIAVLNAPPKPPKEIYRGPIHAGDKFSLSEEAHRGAFVWGKTGNKVELRSYRNPDSDPICRFIDEFRLRKEYTRVVPNPVGTLVCPPLRECKC